MWSSRTVSRALASLCMGIALAAAPPPAKAQESGAGHTAHSGLVGIGAALCTLVYTPLKVTYAVTGSVLSGMAWLWTLGDTDVAGPILNKSVRGHYVVVPGHLTGAESLEFVGKNY